MDTLNTYVQDISPSQEKQIAKTDKEIAQKHQKYLIFFLIKFMDKFLGKFGSFY